MTKAKQDKLMDEIEVIQNKMRTIIYYDELVGYKEGLEAKNAAAKLSLLHKQLCKKTIKLTNQ